MASTKTIQNQQYSTQNIKDLYSNISNLNGDIPTHLNYAKMQNWRKNIPNTIHNSTDMFSQVSAQIPNESKNITCMSQSNDKPLVAIGSAGSAKNVFLVEYESSSSKGQQTPFNIRATYQSLKPVRSIDIQSELILCGSDESMVQLLKYQGQNQIQHASSFVLPLNKNNNAPDGWWSKTNCVKSVQWNHKQKAQFAAVDDVNFRLWDIHKDSAPLISCKVSQSPIQKCSWNHDHGSVISFGSQDGSIMVLDLRSMSNKDKPVIKIDNSSIIQWFDYQSFGNSSVTGLEFNSKVPFWLSSSSESGFLRLHDLRFVSGIGPVAQCKFNSSVNDISWSCNYSNVLSVCGDNGLNSQVCFDSNLASEVQSSDFSKKHLIAGAKTMTKYSSDSEMNIQLENFVSTVGLSHRDESYLAVTSSGELSITILKKNLLNSYQLFKDLSKTKSGRVQLDISSYDFTKPDVKLQIFADTLEEDKYKGDWQFGNDALLKTSNHLQGIDNYLSKNNLNIFQNIIDPVDISSATYSQAKFSPADFKMMYDKPNQFYDIGK